MKKIDVNQTVNTLANIGVIAGIIFLGFELQQNNRYMQEQARYNMFQNRVSQNVLVAEDADLARLYYWRSGDDDLSEIDKRRREDFIFSIFLKWQFDFDSVRLGVLAEGGFPADAVKDNWNSLDVREVWERRKARLSRTFVEWMEKNVIL